MSLGHLIRTTFSGDAGLPVSGDAPLRQKRTVPATASATARFSENCWSAGRNEGRRQAVKVRFFPGSLLQTCSCCPRPANWSWAHTTVPSEGLSPSEIRAA